MKAKIRSMLGSLIIVAIILVFSFPAMATDVGGIIDSDTTWDLAGSPYNITSDVQIAEGVTLTVDPGVVVSGGIIKVWGVLNAIGTDSLNIILNYVYIKPQTGVHLPLPSPCAVVNIQFAQITSGCPFDGRGTLTLLDSRVQNTIFINLTNYGSSLIERNIFQNSGGIKIGFMEDDTVYVRNNLFYQQTTDYAIIAEMYNVVVAEAVVEYNSFLSTDRIAIMVSANSMAANMLAINNYWNTTDIDIIDSMIFDRNNDLGCPYYVDYIPFLTEPQVG